MPERPEPRRRIITLARDEQGEAWIEIWQHEWPFLVWSEDVPGDRTWVKVRVRKSATPWSDGLKVRVRRSVRDPAAPGAEYWSDVVEDRPLGSVIVYAGNTRDARGKRPGPNDFRAGEELPAGSDLDAIAAAIRRVCAAAHVSKHAAQNCIDHLPTKEL